MFKCVQFPLGNKQQNQDLSSNLPDSKSQILAFGSTTW